MITIEVGFGQGPTTFARIGKETRVDILLAIGALVTLGIAAYFFGYDSRQMGALDRVNGIRF